MPSLKLSNLFRHATTRQSLKERAASLRANVGALIHADASPAGEPAGSDAELLALAPIWEAAVNLEIQRIAEETTTAEASCGVAWPGPAPADSGPAYETWRRQRERWHLRSGMAAAEKATAAAGRAVHKIELQIASMPAATLAGLKLKARVAKRSDDLGVVWPDQLGEGLARDILALSDVAPAPSQWRLSPTRRWAIGQAATVDLSGLKILELHNLYNLFASASDAWNAAACLPWADESLSAGEVVEREDERAAEIRDRIVAEISTKVPTERLEHGWRLETLIRHALLCEGSLQHAPELRAEINKAWGG